MLQYSYFFISGFSIFSPLTDTFHLFLITKSLKLCVTFNADFDCPKGSITGERFTSILKKLTAVPSFSKKEVAGISISALFVISVGNILTDNTKSILSNAFSAKSEGNEDIGSAPKTRSDFIRPSAAAFIICEADNPLSLFLSLYRVLYSPTELPPVYNGINAESVINDRA